MKFSIEAIRRDEYEIEIDESIWDKYELNEWSKFFHPVSDIEEIAKYLCFMIMRFGANRFIEGFGYVKQFRRDGTPAYKTGEHDDFAKGISVRIISGDEDYEFNSSKID